MLQKSIARVPRWTLTAAVLAFVSAGLTALAVFGAAVLPARSGPPIEELAVERTVLSPSTIELTVRNTGPDPVTVAQVSVNDSFVDFAEQPSATDVAGTTGGPGPIGRLGTATLRLDYPWQDGMPYHVSLLTSTGLVIEHEIPVAVLSPTDDGASIGRMALLGVMIGIVPVLLGMTVLPVLRRSGPTTARVLLAVTVGLLGFLAVDAVIDGVEVAAATGGAFGGVALVVLGAALAFLGLAAVDSRPAGEPSGPRLALLVAVGIGLHNLSEGLAVGSAFAVGELVLGATLVAGFAAHNTTEGIAVIAPLTDHPVSPSRLLGLGLVAGAPAILGAVAGATATSPVYAAFLLGLGIGAIVQVVVKIAPLLRPGPQRGLDTPALAGLGGGVLLMYLTGLLVLT